MTRLEKMKELLNLPVEELAEKIATAESGTATILSKLWENIYDYDEGESYPTPGARYCLQNHEECQWLDTFYDPECRYLYGSCNAGYHNCECPYGVDRKEVLKNTIIENLNEEVEK